MSIALLHARTFLFTNHPIFVLKLVLPEAQLPHQHTVLGHLGHPYEQHWPYMSSNLINSCALQQMLCGSLTVAYGTLLSPTIDVNYLST